MMVTLSNRQLELDGLICPCCGRPTTSDRSGAWHNVCCDCNLAIDLDKTGLTICRVILPYALLWYDGPIRVARRGADHQWGDYYLLGIDWVDFSISAQALEGMMLLR